MTDRTDHELLAEFARTESEAAFATLVARHVNLVYSAALRRVANPHHAQEITQAVFIILARKSGRLSPRVVLSGWLYQTARLTAANFLKGELRRQRREQEAFMQSTLNETDAAAWAQLAPLLDDAMGRLGETDRAAVVLSYFENKTAAEVAVALQTTEAAAHKRVNRALEKLRKIFSQRGVTLTTALIGSAVAANSVQAAPLGLAATVTATAAKGTLLSATITTLVKGTMKTMTWLKIKFAAGVGTAALLVGGAATVAVSQTGKSNDGVAALEVFQKARAAYAALSSYSDEGRTVSAINGTTFTHTFRIKLARPNLYRIEWAQPVHTSYTNTGVVWSAGDGDFMVMGESSAQKQSGKEMALAGAAGVSGSAAATIPGTFFELNWGSQLLKTGSDEKRLADEKVGGVECFVFTSELKGRTRTIWIGKQDFFIRQVRTETSAKAMRSAMEAAAKVNPTAAARLKDMKVTASTSTELHENIVVNQKLSPKDFAR